MNAKKIVTWLAVAFVVFYLLSEPTGSADIVKGAIDGLGEAAGKMADFVGNLAPG